MKNCERSNYQKKTTGNWVKKFNWLSFLSWLCISTQKGYISMTSIYVYINLLKQKKIFQKSFVYILKLKELNFFYIIIKLVNFRAFFYNNSYRIFPKTKVTINTLCSTMHPHTYSYTYTYYIHSTDNFVYDYKQI